MPSPAWRRGRRNDVRREQQRVGEGEHDPGRLAGEVHAGEDVHAGDGERERGDVARGPCAQRRQRDRPAGTRSPRRSRAAAGRSRCRSSSSSPPARPPTASTTRLRSSGTMPARRHSANTTAAVRIRSQATPSSGDAREQQHRERGAEVVEDRAADEVRLGRTLALRRATDAADRLARRARSRTGPIEGILSRMAANGRLDDVDRLLIEELQARRASEPRRARPPRRADAAGRRRPPAQARDEGTITGYTRAGRPARARATRSRRSSGSAPRRG